MGDTFGSIHIKEASLDGVTYLAAGHIVCQTMPGWVSVLDEAFGWGSTQPEARKISAALPEKAVLCVEYFDNDFVEFALYHGGKKRTRHIPATYEHIDRHVGHMADFVELLELEAEEEKLLRLVFKETQPDTAVYLFESLLHCPIRMDPAAPEASKAARDRTYLEEYAARKRQRVRNHTKLALTDEGEVVLEHYHLTYPFPRQFPTGEALIYGVDELGRIVPVDESLPPNVFMGRSSFLDGFHRDVWLPPGVTDEAEGVRYEVRGWRTLVSLGTGERRVMAELKLPENEIVQLLCPLPGIGAVLLLGESTLEVYDKNLVLLSRHKMKGWTAGTLPREDGTVSILTYRQGESEGFGKDRRVIRPDWVRVYRLGK